MCSLTASRISDVYPEYIYSRLHVSCYFFVFLVKYLDFLSKDM